ncbi:MAG: MFS transporter [Victivallales bacterium]|nr:MFS transporter [Victivallales bacterium]
MEEYPYWRRNLWVLWVAQFVSVCGFSLSIPFAPYFLRELAPEATAAQIRFYAALAAFISQLGFAIFSPIWGWLADRYGRKNMALRAAFGGTLVLGLMGFSQNVTQFILLRALQGILTGTIAASMTLIACTTPQEKQGYALGIYSSSLFSGDMTGLFLGGFMAANFGFRNSFHISAILVLGTALLILFGAREDFHREAPLADAIRNHESDLWHSALLPALPALFIYSFSCLAYCLDESQVALYVEQLNGGPAQPGRELLTSLTLGAGSLGAMSAGLILSHFIDRNPSRLACLSAIAAGLAMLTMALLPQWLPATPRAPFLGHFATWSALCLIPLRLLTVFFAGGVDTICNTWISKVTLPAHRGIMFGISRTFRAIGTCSGHLTAGAVAPTLGITTLYYIGPLAFFLLATMVFFLSKVITVRIEEVNRLTVTAK